MVWKKQAAVFKVMLPQAMPTSQGRGPRMYYSVSTFPTAPRRPPDKAATSNLISIPGCHLLTSDLFFSWQAGAPGLFLVLIAIFFLPPVLGPDSVARSSAYMNPFDWHRMQGSSWATHHQPLHPSPSVHGKAKFFSPRQFQSSTRHAVKLSQASILIKLKLAEIVPIITYLQKDLISGPLIPIVPTLNHVHNMSFIFKYMSIRITFILHTSWNPDFSVIKIALLEYSKYSRGNHLIIYSESCFDKWLVSWSWVFKNPSLKRMSQTEASWKVWFQNIKAGRGYVGEARKREGGQENPTWR